MKRKPESQRDRVSEYAPLASVWYGEDPELIEKLLSFYPRKRPRKILDATVNGGRFWRGSKRSIIGIDYIASFSGVNAPFRLALGRIYLDSPRTNL